MMYINSSASTRSTAQAMPSCWRALKACVGHGPYDAAAQAVPSCKACLATGNMLAQKMSAANQMPAEANQPRKDRERLSLGEGDTSRHSHHANGWGRLRSSRRRLCHGRCVVYSVAERANVYVLCIPSV
jgi:hypothetical protein